MDIIFLWDERMPGSPNGICLGRRYTLNYCIDDDSLEIKKNKTINQLWGNTVTDCIAIVGENGSGKTKMLNYLMEDIYAINIGITTDYQFIIVAEKDGQITVLGNLEKEIYIINKPENICSEYISNKINCEECRSIINLDVAYFTNQLTRFDYMNELPRCKYDFSVGQKIRSYRKESFEMHYHDLERDEIANYYSVENYNILQFLYESIGKFSKNTSGILEIFPREVFIRIVDSQYYFDYIFLEAEKVIKAENNSRYKDLLKIFKEKLKGIKILSNWDKAIVYYLTLNLFRRLCIPQTTGENRSKSNQIKIFLEAGISIFDNSVAVNSSEKLSKLLEKLKDKMCDNYLINDINNTRDFLTWLKENKEIIDGKTNNDFLQVPICKETEQFIRSLIHVYKKVNFAYPFLNFEYDISSGEFNYLILFCDIYKIASKMNVINSEAKKDLLLLFDEAELSMHPRWQRKYVDWIVQFCNNAFEGIGVKILIATHSPILLSDFITANVIYVKRKNNNNEYFIRNDFKPFACNVHTLYSDAFFLDDEGTIGEFSKKYIIDLAKKITDSDNGLIDIDDEIEIIGEKVFRFKLKELVKRHDKN